MSISNGQDANETNFNNAFASKSSDNSLSGKQNLTNADAASGSSVTNVQREINSLNSFTGRSSGSAYNIKPTWSDNSVGASTDDVKARADALTTYAKSLSDNKITGPASSTDNALIRFDATTGKLAQNSGVIVDDSNNITGVNNLTVTGNLTVNGTTTTVNSATLDITDANITVNDGGNQAAADDVAGLTVEMSDATHAKLIYDKDATSKFRIGNAGSEKEVVTISDTQEITNKKITGGTATAGNNLRLSVPKATTATLNTLGRIEGAVFYSTDEAKYYGDDGTNLVDLGSGGGGGSGGINYITNTGAETNTTGWVTYADAASSIPDNGVGGSANITLTRNTTNPLRDVASFLLTKDAANRQGEGVSVEFNIDLADVSKVLQVSFDYQITSGTYADNDIGVYLYDTDNIALIYPTVINLKNHNAVSYLGAERFFTEFQVPNNTNSLRLILHIASTSASAYTIKFDNVIVGPQAKSYGSPITDYSSTPAPSTSISSATNNNYFWKRVGDEAFIQAGWTYTGAGTGLDSLTPAMILPSGFSLDTSKFGNYLSGANDDFAVVGTYYAIDTGVVIKNGSVAYDKTNNLFKIFDSDIGLVPFTVGSGDAFTIMIRVPILGWSSSLLMSNDADTRVVASIITGDPSSASSGNPVIVPTVGYDSHNAYNNSTGRYTVPVTGLYKMFGALQSANTGVALNIYKNASSGQLVGSTDSNGEATYCGMVSCVAGDIIDIRPNNTLDPSSMSLNIEKISGPSQIMASEDINEKYSTNAGGSFANTGVNIIDFEDQEYSTHGGVTTGASWKYTSPIAQKVQISASIHLQSAAWTAGNRALLYVYKNGSVAALIDRFSWQATVTDQFAMNGSTDLRLVPGDYIDVRLDQNRTGGNISLTASTTENFVCIKKIGNY